MLHGLACPSLVTGVIHLLCLDRQTNKLSWHQDVDRATLPCKQCDKNSSSSSGSSSGGSSSGGSSSGGSSSLPDKQNAGLSSWLWTWVPLSFRPLPDCLYP
jgi:uncharacterized membrane protein YgcG